MSQFQIVHLQTIQKLPTINHSFKFFFLIACYVYVKSDKHGTLFIHISTIDRQLFTSRNKMKLFILFTAFDMETVDHFLLATRHGKPIHTKKKSDQSSIESVTWFRFANFISCKILMIHAFKHPPLDHYTDTHTRLNEWPQNGIAFNFNCNTKI